MADVAIHHVQVAPAPEVVTLHIVGKDIGEGGAEVANLIGPVKDDGEVELFLHHLPEVVELHLVHDDVVGRLHVTVGKEHKVYVGIAECRRPPRTILRRKFSEIGKEYDDAFH